MEELKLKKEPHLDAFNGINIDSDTKKSESVENENNKGMGFPSQEKEPVPLFSSTASVQDLRSLYIEKERKICDEPSPRGVLEDILRSSESEFEPSKASTLCSEDQAIPAIPSQWRDYFRSWRHKSMRRLMTFPPVGVSKISRRRSCRECPAPRPNHSPASAEDEFHFFKPAWKNFTLKELQLATDNFSSENIIGKGGYGEVFKGCLEDGLLVAVKRLTRGTQDDRTSDFLSELGIIVHISHPNAAKLIGFGIEGGMHLVLQLSPNGSLASLLNGSRERLNWAVRYKIAIGTAEGLRYLHENCQRRIIHRDIKAANILLTEDFAPQICDFGLAKWLPDQWTHHTMSSFEGTFGYMAPEYLMHGIVDEKTDVYAFGVLLLELITGRRALVPLQESLVIWAKPLLQKNDFRQLIDSSLGDAYNHQQLNRMVLTSSLCVQQSPLLRPPMSQILQFLRGAEGNIASPKPCKRMGMQRTYSEEIFDAEEYNDTRYLKDLHRHREIAMDFSEQ